MKSIDFTLRKVWVGNDDELREKVVKKLAEYNIIISGSACCKGKFSCLWIPGPKSAFGTYDQNYSKQEFDKEKHISNSTHKELSIEELLDEQVAYQIY